MTISDISFLVEYKPQIQLFSTKTLKPMFLLAQSREEHMTKFIIITGGVLSGLGKGIVTSSLGKLLKSHGFSVTAIKMDPYLNCDAGTMNPFEHGEVFVLKDGTEVDLDFGNYERFMDLDLCADDNITTGKVYRSVIEKERSGEYLGKTVQIIPHVTDEIIRRIWKVANDTGSEIVLIELGGTVGDIESAPFLEASRQLRMELGDDIKKCFFIHTTLVPTLSVVGEQKTKPTQHSVQELRAIGIEPNVIVGRADRYLERSTKKKISLFCDVPVEAVVSSPDASNIYQVPLILDEEGLADYVMMKMGMDDVLKEKNLDAPGLGTWKQFLERYENPESDITIALVGKYCDLKDAYTSHEEALNHCRAETRTRINIKYIESEDLESEENIEKMLGDVDGILIPGGFGVRGIDGKINAIRYARTNNTPLLSICLGFQVSVIEFARNVLGYEDANSSEFDDRTKHPVIDLMAMQRGIDMMGGTMRLGTEKVLIDKGTKVHDIYSAEEIEERHRHRYEVNLDFKDKLEENGLIFSGKSVNKKRMEILEIPEHPFFIGCQFHPEFTSRPLKPAPLFLALVNAIREQKK